MLGDADVLKAGAATVLVGASVAVLAQGDVDSDIGACGLGADGEASLTVTVVVSALTRPSLEIRFGAGSPLVVQLELSTDWNGPSRGLPTWGKKVLRSDRYGGLVADWKVGGSARTRISLPVRALKDILDAGALYEINIEGLPTMQFVVPEDDFRHIVDIACRYATER